MNKISLCSITSLSQEIPPSFAFLRGAIIWNSMFIIPMHVCIFYCVCMYLWAIYSWTYLENIVLTGLWSPLLKSCLLSPNQCHILFSLPPNCSFHLTPFYSIILHSILRDYHKTYIRSSHSSAENPWVVSH